MFEFSFEIVVIVLLIFAVYIQFTENLKLVEQNKELSVELVKVRTQKEDNSYTLEFMDKELCRIKKQFERQQNEQSGNVSRAEQSENVEQIPTRDIPTRDIPTRDIPTRDIPTRDIPTRDIPTSESVSLQSIPALVGFPNLQNIFGAMHTRSVSIASPVRVPSTEREES